MRGYLLRWVPLTYLKPPNADVEKHAGRVCDVGERRQPDSTPAEDRPINGPLRHRVSGHDWARDLERAALAAANYDVDETRRALADAMESVLLSHGPHSLEYAAVIVATVRLRGERVCGVRHHPERLARDLGMLAAALQLQQSLSAAPSTILDTTAKIAAALSWLGQSVESERMLRWRVRFAESRLGPHALAVGRASWRLGVSLLDGATAVDRIIEALVNVERAVQIAKSHIDDAEEGERARSLYYVSADSRAEALKKLGRQADGLMESILAVDMELAHAGNLLVGRGPTSRVHNLAVSLAHCGRKADAVFYLRHSIAGMRADHHHDCPLSQDEELLRELLRDLHG